MKYERVKSFTGLRFLMIMIIVISHFEFLKECGAFGSFYYKFLYNATFPVDFFFLVSGFGMMLGNLSKYSDEKIKMPSIKENITYGISHIKKIYPVYIATIIIGLLWNIAGGIYRHTDAADIAMREFVKLAVNIPLLQSATGMFFFTHAYNGVTWFLSCLFCIYLFSPSLMFILRKGSKSIKINVICILVNLVLIIVLAKILSIFQDYLSEYRFLRKVNILTYVSPYIRVFYVLTGMNLALIFAKIKNKNITFTEKKANLYEILVFSLFIMYFVLRNSISGFSYSVNFKYVLDIMLCSIFIFVFAFDAGCISKVFKRDILQTLGNMAMYVFLIHYPIRIYLDIIVRKYVEMNIYVAFAEICVILALTFFISYRIYKRTIYKSIYG